LYALSELLVRFRTHATDRRPSLREDRVDKAVSDSVEKQLRSAFPPGRFTRVDVLGHGDDPDVEPGETAVRASVDRAGHPAESWEDDEKVLQAFEKAHGHEIRKLRHAGLLPSVVWVQFIPDSPARRASCGALYGFPSMFLDGDPRRCRLAPAGWPKG
jgi:hypothetical protein